MKKSELHQKTRHHGFTITELLVVIAIIAVLAALTFAVVSRARNGAHTVTCVSNQRQIMLGMIEWLGDNNDRAPQYVYPVQSGGGYYWYAQLTLSSNVRGGDTLPPAPHKPLRPGESKNIWVCPASDPYKESATRRRISYAINRNCLYSEQTKSLMRMSDPTRTISICCGNLLGPNNYVIKSDEDIGTSHGGGTVAAFWDGHVEVLKKAPEFSSRSFQFYDDE
tara:strand:+ start:475 stop:1143 length:669 start_codon:yes stop_codon:yes gene_type:complete